MQSLADRHSHTLRAFKKLNKELIKMTIPLKFPTSTILKFSSVIKQNSKNFIHNTSND
jgi:hypothetical protein